MTSNHNIHTAKVIPLPVCFQQPEKDIAGWWIKPYKSVKYGILIRMRLVLLSVCCCCVMLACKKEDALTDIGNIPGLGGDKWVKGPIDFWIYDSLTKPYNIAVKYKWDQFELELNKTIVPPKEDKVIPVMEAVKKVWINSYVEAAGELFFRKYAPKFFVLAGSAVYNTDGSITLGTAEGGRKVVLYVLNEFRMKGMAGFTPADSVTIKQLFHTIEHEFGHILHQHVLYPEDFKRICIGLYTANWNNTSDATALRDGFVTSYAMNAPDEDFVEMLAVMLVEGRRGFDKLVNGIPAGTSINGTTQAEAKTRLRQKEGIVVSYLKDVWDIDLYQLQNATRTAVESLIQ